MSCHSRHLSKGPSTTGAPLDTGRDSKISPEAFLFQGNAHSPLNQSPEQRCSSFWSISIDSSRQPRLNSPASGYHAFPPVRQLHHMACLERRITRIWGQSPPWGSQDHLEGPDPATGMLPRGSACDQMAPRSPKLSIMPLIVPRRGSGWPDPAGACVPPQPQLRDLWLFLIPGSYF